MAYRWQLWMADEFRAAGLRVVEIDGWRTRGRPASSGSFDPSGLLVHHTGATSRPDSWAPGLTTLIAGRSDLPGPLCQYAVDYGGTVYVIAAGRANHAGRNGGVPGFPAGDGNAQLVGNEVITDGRQALPIDQLRAIDVTSAVVLRHYAKGTTALYRHADTSVTGKWDIGQLSTPVLRDRVAVALQTLAEPVTENEESDDMPLSRLMRAHDDPMVWVVDGDFQKRTRVSNEQELADLLTLNRENRFLASEDVRVVAPHVIGRAVDTALITDIHAATRPQEGS